MATTNPRKRVYLDSNVLHSWPNGANWLWNALSAARWLGSELYIPETVEEELQAQFVRGVQTAYDAIDGQVKVLRKLCRNIINPDVGGKGPATYGLLFGIAPTNSKNTSRSEPFH